MPTQKQLFWVIHAKDALRLGFGFTKSWDKQAREDRDNRDDDEQLDQCESRTSGNGIGFGFHRRKWTGCCGSCDTFRIGLTSSLTMFAQSSSLFCGCAAERLTFAISSPKYC